MSDKVTTEAAAAATNICGVLTMYQALFKDLCIYYFILIVTKTLRAVRYVLLFILILQMSEPRHRD